MFLKFEVQFGWGLISQSHSNALLTKLWYYCDTDITHYKRITCVCDKQVAVEAR